MSQKRRFAFQFSKKPTKVKKFVVKKVSGWGNGSCKTITPGVTAARL